ncbi:MAG: class I SAM-dependent methyltransferase [Candidatus Omnitrophica bacterium]|nr:class I SAM-dependent methyltransferase [Candidatus Omnitrophota bacterium]
MKINEQTIQAIEALPGNWHACGTISNSVLRVIVKHALSLGEIKHSLETGSGRSTLLFSHLSEDHLVFALDVGESVCKVRSSALLSSKRVRYVEGPTQKTLPQFQFSHKFQVALIDGPHGYPFPDLEYFYIYPLIEEGGLLIIDDIRIPSIKRMFDIINAEHMFELVEIVDRNTAFFRRTSAQLIDPFSDSWWNNGYNQDHYRRILAKDTIFSRIKSAFGINVS